MNKPFNVHISFSEDTTKTDKRIMGIDVIFFGKNCSVEFINKNIVKNGEWIQLSLAGHIDEYDIEIEYKHGKQVWIKKHEG